MKSTPKSIFDKTKMLHEIHTSNGTYDPLGFEDVALEYDCNPPEIAVHVLVPTAGIPRTINVEEEEEEESDAILLEAWSKGEAQPLAYRDKKFAVAFWVHIALLMLAAPFAPSAIKSIVKDEANIDKNRFLRNVNLAVNPRNTRVRRVEAGKRGELKKSIRRSNAADYGYDGPFDGGSPGYGYDGPFDGGQGTKAVGSGDSASSGGARYGYDGPFDGNHFYPGYDSGDYYGDSASSGGARYGYDGPFDGSDSFGGFDVSRAIEFSILVVIASLAISFGLIMGALHYLQLQSEKVIKGSLFCIIGYLTLFGSLTLFLPAREADEDGKAAMAIVYFVLALIFACYAKVIWRDIPYAAVTLRTGVTACRANIGGKMHCQFRLCLWFDFQGLTIYSLCRIVFSFAFFSPLLNFIMFIIQTMAFIAVLSLFGAFEDDPSDSAAAGSTFAFLFFCLSIYWTSEVIKNISTVIVSGTVGTWWVAPLEASSFCSIAVLDSIRRATTYSFGSICYGSLIVAILNVIIDSLRRFRGNSNCILFYCCIQCILQFLERIAVYFNKWAMIHVGIYGKFDLFASYCIRYPVQHGLFTNPAFSP